MRGGDGAGMDIIMNGMQAAIQNITKKVDDEYIEMLIEASYDLGEKMTKMYIIAGQPDNIRYVLNGCAKFRFFCRIYKVSDINYLQQIWNYKTTLEYTANWLWLLGYNQSKLVLGEMPYFKYLMRAVRALNRNYRQRLREHNL